MEATTTRQPSIFDFVLDDLLTATRPAAGPNVCGQCHETFPTLDEVFSHDCAGSHAYPEVAVEAPHRHHGGGYRPANRETVGPVEPTPVAEVEALLRSLGRKIEEQEVTPQLAKAAKLWAAEYTGDFGFMQDMARQARSGRFTTRMAKGVLNCWRADVNRRPAVDLGVPQADEATDLVPEAPAARPARTNRYAGKCGNCHRHVEAETGTVEKVDGRWMVWHREGECPMTEYKATDGTTVPEGRYAYADETGTMKFYVLGETGIAAQGSDNLYDLRSRENQQAVVDRIAQDIEGCARTYGRELGECCRCGRTLTSEWRQQGIGPVCASKADW